jgi:hypothetical protein
VVFVYGQSLCPLADSQFPCLAWSQGLSPALGAYALSWEHVQYVHFAMPVRFAGLVLLLSYAYILLVTVSRHLSYVKRTELQRITCSRMG